MCLELNIKKCFLDPQSKKKSVGHQQGHRRVSLKLQALKNHWGAYEKCKVMDPEPFPTWAWQTQTVVWLQILQVVLLQVGHRPCFEGPWG